MKKLIALASLLLCSAPAVALANASIVIVNLDGPGEGFNDPTPAAPVGGNMGTTIGQQRLNAFQAAADIWGQSIDSDVPILIDANFDPLTCTATTATLGAAGAITLTANFPGAPLTSTWYPVALANTLSGTDLDPTASDLGATFNSNLGQPGCLAGIGWYLGLDGNHGSDTDLVTVLIHEFAHGLGFAAYFNKSSGAEISGMPDVYERQLSDGSTLFSSMSNTQRASATLNTRRIFWSGATVTDAVPDLLAPGTPLLSISAPASIAGGYAIGLAPDFGAPMTTSPVAADLVVARDAANGAGPSMTDGCTALTNGAAVAGKLAVVDRGTCPFTVKAKNVQDAGAIGVIIVDNVAGSPPPELGGSDPTVVIPAVRISLQDGNTIKARLSAGDTVPGNLHIDMTRLQGADAGGHALLYTPNPVEAGSSISHFDTIAFPNLLMEPFINDDLAHGTDLALPLLMDLGWPLCHDNADCSDGDACNGAETCSNFRCAAGSPPVCTSGSVCLVASCDPAVGCVQTPVPNGTSCADGTACNGDESCVAGACTPGTAPNCVDGNSCTTDGCNPLTGCSHDIVPDGSSCSDGNACSQADSCEAGQCIGSGGDCNDNNVCTADACDLVSGCAHSFVPSGTACGGGGTCNGAGACANAKCQGVKLVNNTPGIVPSGGSALLSATNVSCGSGQTPEYRFLYRRGGGPTTYTEFRGWSTSPNAAFNNAGLPSGSYTVLVRARAVGSTKAYESYKTITVLSGNICTAVTLARSPSTATVPGVLVDLTATATCTEGPGEYEFSFKPPGASTYTLLRTWGGATVTWDTTARDFGSHTLLVKARGAGNTTKVESQKTASHMIADQCVTLSISASPASPNPVGTQVDILAEASCNEGTTPELRFRYRAQGSTAWTELQNWGLATSAPWATAGLVPGSYELRVESRSPGVNTAQKVKVISYSLTP